MSRKFKIAIASLMLLGTASAAPAYAAPRHSAPVNSWQEREDVPVAGPGYYEGDYQFNVDRFDHASSPYAGGGGK
jgi:opacity protein-like surface antigen